MSRSQEYSSQARKYMILLLSSLRSFLLTLYRDSPTYTGIRCSQGASSGGVRKAEQWSGVPVKAARNRLPGGKDRRPGLTRQGSDTIADPPRPTCRGADRAETLPKIATMERRWAQRPSVIGAMGRYVTPPRRAALSARPRVRDRTRAPDGAPSTPRRGGKRSNLEREIAPRERDRLFEIVKRSM